MAINTGKSTTLTPTGQSAEYMFNVTAMRKYLRRKSEPLQNVSARETSMMSCIYIGIRVNVRIAPVY